MNIEEQLNLPSSQKIPATNTATNNNLPSDVLPVAKNAFRAAVVYLFASFIAFAGEIYFVFQTPVWQAYALAAIGGALALVSVAVIALIRQGRHYAGIRLLIGASLVSVLLAPFLVRGFGLIVGLGIILLVLTIALQTLPQREANWVILISVVVAVIAGGLDLLALQTQLNLPEFRNLILILGTFSLLVSGGLTIGQFNAYPLTTKLILTFFAISLMPLGLLAFVNDRNTRAVLTEDAQQSLFSAAIKTAADIDTFINNNLNTIRTEAQLPVLVTFLKLPPTLQLNSIQAETTASTLRELSRKDKIFIDSYALLNLQGQNRVDTYAPNIGTDESTRSYFLKPLETGLPYVSPIEFDRLTVGGESQEQPGWYFSSPVRDSDSGDIIGVLRVRYQPKILQQIIVQNNNLVGQPYPASSENGLNQNSFAILFDENYIRLAHGAAPNLIFTAAGELESELVQRLQTANRLPVEATPADYTDAIPELVDGLNNAIFEPNFSTPLLPTGDNLNLAVAAELESQPWIVLFAQPEEVFLAPIQHQARTTLFLAIAIAGVVTAAAYGIGHFLAEPLVHLTKVVTQFTTGNLEARAELKSGDESGILAASFNAMAAQVGSLVKNLADRTRQLENEIVERERAEAELEASEEKYRHLFEDSRDVIFITAVDGQIIDINPRSEILFGYSTEVLKQMNALNLYVDSKQAELFQRTIEQKGSIRDFEVQFRRRDGIIRDCLITATMWQDDDHNVLGYQGIIRDITAQKQVEKEHLRLMSIEQELMMAQEIQQRLLPPAQPAWNNLDAVFYSTPAREVGGDLFAYHAFSDQRFAVTVGDVSGKGMPAALLMAVTVSSFQAVVGQALRPQTLLTHLNHTITPYTRETNQNCALIYAELALNGDQQAKLCVANAGCMIPLILRSDNSLEWVDVVGMPLGMNLGAILGYAEVEAELSVGDFVILTSDGVVEAMNYREELFGFDRLEEAVASGPTSSAQAMLNHLTNKVNAFVGSTEPHDDITIVVVKI